MYIEKESDLKDTIVKRNYINSDFPSEDISKKLSKENFDRLSTTIVYKKDPPSDDITEYWARNWEFRVIKHSDQTAFMVDTYGNCFHSEIRVTDKNIDEFKVFFDFREVRPLTKKEEEWYDYNDFIVASLDNGGRGKYRLIRKDAKVSKKALERSINYHLINIKSEVVSERAIIQDLEKQLKENGYWSYDDSPSDRIMEEIEDPLRKIVKHYE